MKRAGDYICISVQMASAKKENSKSMTTMRVCYPATNAISELYSIADVF